MPVCTSVAMVGNQYVCSSVSNNKFLVNDGTLRIIQIVIIILTHTLYTFSQRHDCVLQHLHGEQQQLTSRRPKSIHLLSTDTQFKDTSCGALLKHNQYSTSVCFF